MKQRDKPLWRCQQCQRLFANEHQLHACADYTLAEHLEGKAPEVQALYHYLEEAIQGLGPVIVELAPVLWICRNLILLANLPGKTSFERIS